VVTENQTIGGLIFLLHISGKTMGFVLGKLRKRRRDGIRCGDARIFDCSDVSVFSFLFLSILAAVPMEQKFISTVDRLLKSGP
jgi:hypothetical protein